MKKEKTMPAKNLTVVKTSPRAVKITEAPADYIALAIEKNLSPEILAKLIDNAERIDALRSLKAFDAAMSAAKADLPKILKNREVDFTSQRGRTNYKYEDFAGVAEQVDSVLSQHGLSYRFRTSGDKDTLTVQCVMTGHGHREETSLTAPLDHSGNKNAIQAIGSTQTYLQRYTLKAALGLAAARDDDVQSVGRAEDKPKPKLEPKPVDPPIDKDTGEILPPHAVDPPKRDDGSIDWIGYGSLMVAATKNAKTKDEITDWVDKNNLSLTAMEAEAPKVYARLKSAIGLI